MSVITNFPAMPNRIAIATEYLFGLGEKGGNWDSIEGQLSPLTQNQDEDGPEEKTGKSMAQDVLLEMDKLQMLERLSPNTIALQSDIRAAAPRDGNWQNALYPFFFSVLTDPVRAAQHGQDDVPDSLAWLLTQDPTAPLPFKGGVHAERIAQQLDPGDALRIGLGNNSRYQNLVYWARYLGLAVRVGYRMSATNTVDTVVPDPTEAIAARLPVVFQKDREISVQTFLQRLAAEISVIDGGTARRNFEVRIKSEFQPMEKRVSRSLSMALVRLRVRRELRLDNFSDADAWLLDLGRKSEAVSHVTYIVKESS
jgi:hypothetical protein